MNRLPQLIACFLVLATAVSTSRAELFVVQVPALARPKEQAGPDILLPDADATLTKGWNDYETRCCAATTSLLDAIRKQFDLACESKDPKSLDRAEAWRNLETRLKAGECIIVRKVDGHPSDHIFRDREIVYCGSEDLVAALKAAEQAYKDAHRDLKHAYEDAVQMYKQIGNIAQARATREQFDSLDRSYRMPWAGLPRLLEGRWLESGGRGPFVRVFRGDHMTEYNRSEPETVHASGPWIVRPSEGKVHRRDADAVQHGKSNSTLFKTTFAVKPNKFSSVDEPDLVVLLDNGYSLKVLVLDQNRILIEPVDPLGKSLKDPMHGLEHLQLVLEKEK